MDYKLLATEIIESVGGPSNIASHTHCVTRLRFQINNRSIVDEKRLRDMDGVRGIMDQGGIFQVIIGPNVDKVYTYVKDICDSASAEITGKQNDAKQDQKVEKKDGFINKCLNYISASISPAIPALMFTGFANLLLSLLSTFGILAADNPTYAILNAFSNAGMYFLPAFVAIGAARRLKVNEVLAVLIALMTLHPDFLGIEVKQFFGISLMEVQYHTNIIPILLTIPLFKVLDKLCDSYMPDLIRSIFKPLVSVGLLIPVVLFVTGPVGSVLSKYLADFIYMITTRFGAVSIGLICFFNPVLVMTGMHTVLLPIQYAEFAEFGYSIITTKALPW